MSQPRFQWKAYRAGYVNGGSKEHAMKQVQMGDVLVWTSLCGAYATVAGTPISYRDDADGCKRCARLRETISTTPEA